MTHTFTLKQWAQNLNKLTKVYSRKERSGNHVGCVCTSLLSAATPRIRHATVRAAKTRAIFAVKKVKLDRTKKKRPERFPQQASKLSSLSRSGDGGEGGGAYYSPDGGKGVLMGRHYIEAPRRTGCNRWPGPKGQCPRATGRTGLLAVRRQGDWVVRWRYTCQALARALVI